ncbi:chitin-binding protein [Gracilaria domingensis]|nr:chitin-binding protein [Gracilaria domingensis]
MGGVGHCVDLRPPTPTPSPSPSRSPTPSPSPSRSPTPSPSRRPRPNSPQLPSILSPGRRERLRQLIEAAGGCNANVCFAIDGSGSISSEEFDLEKAFVLDVVSVLTDNPVEVAAVQFSTSTFPIQALTPDVEQFNLRVQATNQIRGASFVAGGVNYCVGQLIRRPGESNKVVLLSDGRSNIGGSASRAADEFRAFGGSVCAVGAGDRSAQELLEIVGGDEDLLFEVDNFLDVFALEDTIERVTLRVCSLLD